MRITNEKACWYNVKASTDDGPTPAIELEVDVEEIMEEFLNEAGTTRILNALPVDKVVEFVFERKARLLFTEEQAGEMYSAIKELEYWSNYVGAPNVKKELQWFLQKLVRLFEEAKDAAKYHSLPF